MMTVDDLRMVVGDITATTKAYVREVVADVRSLVDAQVKALEDRIAAVQTTPGPQGAQGPPGRDADAQEIAAIVKSVVDGTNPPMVIVREEILAELHKALAEIPHFRVVDAEPLIKAEIAEAVKAIPPAQAGKDGRDAVVDFEALAAKAASLVPVPRDGVNGRDAAPPDLDVIAAKAAALIPAPPNPKDGAPGRDGRDGASVTIADLLPLIEARIAAGIAEAVKALPAAPAGRDGQSVTVEDIRPVVLELVQAGIAAQPQARDGRDGLPGVPGPPGEKGLDGINGRDGIDGRPGEKGTDGLDGLGINNAAMTFDETKGYALVMSNGDRSFEMRLPQGWDAGVWRQGRQYPKGCNVTFKGDQWTAQVDTMNRPGDTPDWRLAVRRGRDGKDLRTNAD